MVITAVPSMMTSVGKVRICGAKGFLGEFKLWMLQVLSTLFILIVTGEGDCNSDNDCEGGLVCGNNNCNSEGGFWDPEDDCCTRKCTPDTPCEFGEGACQSDDDCQLSDYHFCEPGVCHGDKVFAKQRFRNKIDLSSSDSCCMR